jgi:hypothetical protein
VLQFAIITAHTGGSIQLGFSAAGADMNSLSITASRMNAGWYPLTLEHL